MPQAVKLHPRFGLLLMLVVALRGQAAAIAYCSNEQNSPVPVGSSGVALALEAAQLQLAATVVTSASGLVAVRLPLTSTGQPEFRAGVLVATANSPSQLLQLRAPGTVALRTYRSAALQQEHVVNALNQVEVTFGQAPRPGSIAKIHRAYATGCAVPEQLKGLLSQFDPLATTHCSTADTDSAGGVCVDSGIANPKRAVDADLTNYASFSSPALLGTGCGASGRFAK